MTPYQNRFSSGGGRVKVCKALQARFTKETELFAKPQILCRLFLSQGSLAKFEENVEYLWQVVQIFFESDVLDDFYNL